MKFVFVTLLKIDNKPITMKYKGKTKVSIIRQFNIPDIGREKTCRKLGKESKPTSIDKNANCVVSIYLFIFYNKWLLNPNFNKILKL